MKKKVLFIGGMLFVVCLFTAVHINLNLKVSDKDFTLSNVEALAQGEGGGSTGCFGSGTIVCNGEAKYYGAYD